VTPRFTRIAATGLAAAAVALVPATSHAIPTERISITVAPDGSAGFGATVTVKSLTNATEKFDIDIVRVTTGAGPRTGGCINVNTCTIAPDAGSGVAAVFEIHAVGGQRTLFDNVFDVFTATAVCTAPNSCVTSPVILALP
jgi:hypothetical protein